MLAAFFALFGLDDYEAPMRPFVAVWMALPLPLAYWLGRKVARTRASFAVLLAGLAVALAVTAWVYWEITWGATRYAESMAGLLFIFAPLYELGWLAMVLLAAWAVGRIRASA